MYIYINICRDPTASSAIAGEGNQGKPLGGNTIIPNLVTEQGFHRFATDSYACHYLEVPTGYRFVLTTDHNISAMDMKPIMWHIYSELFVNCALKNPLYKPGTPIDSIGFINAIDSLIKSLPQYNK